MTSRDPFQPQPFCGSVEQHVHNLSCFVCASVNLAHRNECIQISSYIPMAEWHCQLSFLFDRRVKTTTKPGKQPHKAKFDLFKSTNPSLTLLYWRGCQCVLLLLSWERWVCTLADHLACSIFIFLLSLMFPQGESQPKYKTMNTLSGKLPIILRAKGVF